MIIITLSIPNTAVPPVTGNTISQNISAALTEAEDGPTENWVHTGTAPVGKSAVLNAAGATEYYMADASVQDDYDFDLIPEGTIPISLHTWDGLTSDEYDEDGNLVKGAMTADFPTDKSVHLLHQPDDKDGNPATDYNRLHRFQGWPTQENSDELAVGQVGLTGDMDRDGKPDTFIGVFGTTTVTEDDDSYNLDFDGDGLADQIIPK